MRAAYQRPRHRRHAGCKLVVVMTKLLLALASSTLLLASACGSDTPPPPTCNGTSGACEPGAACDTSGSAC